MPVAPDPPGDREPDGPWAVPTVVIVLVLGAAALIKYLFFR